MLSNLLDRIKLHFQKDSELRKALHSMLGFYPRNLEIYRIALAHKSHVYRNRKGRSFNNERLEFLGDAILEAVVSDIVFHRFERRSEGFLTSTRSKIVQRSSLNRLAKEIGLERLLQVPSQRRGHNSNIGGNAFEALVGAIYLDRGYKTCQWFVENKIVGCLLDIENVANKEVNFKSKLLEWTQKNRVQVDFENEETLDEKNDSPLFNSTILLEGLTVGEGRGYSKKESQQRASRDALTRLRRDPLFVESIFDEKSKRISMEATLIYAPPVIEEIEEALREEAQQAEKAKRKEQARREEKPRNRKAAPKADAPKKEADAPKKEVTKQAKPAPAKEKPAPAKEKPAPAKDRPAPAKEKPAPAKEKPAPAEEKAKQETEQPSEIVLAAVPEQETPAPAPAPAPAAVLDVPAPAASAANESEEAVPAVAKKSRKAHRGSGARRNPNQPAPTPTVAPAQAAAEPAPAEKEAAVPAKEAAAQPKEAAAQPKEAAKPARKKAQPKAKPAAPKSETKESKSEVKESKSEAATETQAAPQKRARRTRKPNPAPAQPTAEELKAREAAIQAAEDAAYAE